MADARGRRCPLEQPLCALSCGALSRLRSQQREFRDTIALTNDDAEFAIDAVQRMVKTIPTISVDAGSHTCTLQTVLALRCCSPRFPTALS